MREDERHGMNAQQFRALVEAYGSVRKRWPDDRRAEAEAFAETEAGRVMLARASSLDELLGRSASPPVSAALSARIVQTANRRVTWQRRVQRWLVGAGLIGVGLAGGLTGALAVAVVAPRNPMPMTDSATAFGNIMTEGEIAQEIR
jgi:hypothetical protein